MAEGNFGIEHKTKPLVEIKPQVQEKSEVTKDLVGEEYSEMFYLLGKVTHERLFKSSENSPRREIRTPLFERQKRAELYKNLLKTLREKDRVGAKAILKEARVRDEIIKQYLNQGEISINLPGLGEQKAKYINVFPPDFYQKEGDKNKPPIFFVPGLSNDIECVGGIVTELVTWGRQVIVVAYPESFNGKTTEEFADAVGKDEGFGPHAEFYKQAIDNLVGENSEVELWGFSTGAPIVAEILKDPNFQNKTRDAVLLSPGGSINQSKLNFGLGGLREISSVKKNFSYLARSNWTYDGSIMRGKKEKRLRRRILNSLIDRINKKYNWSNSRVKEGGKIVVVSGGNDKITKSSKSNKVFIENPQACVLDIKNGYHFTPGIEPEKIIPFVVSAQKHQSYSTIDSVEV